DAPAIVCIHGFGGNADQFRKNMPSFAAAGYDSYAIDLLGYGYCDKPDPKQYPVNEFYNFDTWSDQALSFVRSQVKGPVVLVCNSIGSVVGLQAAIKEPETVKGLVLVDMSLRLLHVKKQSPLTRPFVSALQTFLRETPAGPGFFKQVATPKVLRNILNQAYAFPANLPEGEGVDDETLDFILQPGLDPGAAAVFLDFISYSGGPLPEELLPDVTCPVSILWGQDDPWEPIDIGRKEYGSGKFPCVKEFVPLKGACMC
ncbi:Alpha/Beta hydrolase protein, partial [Ochromonadaceae sp. CCMP2298]